jgi:hypothetical protein
MKKSTTKENEERWGEREGRKADGMKRIKTR